MDGWLKVSALDSYTERRHFVLLVREEVCGHVRQQDSHQPARTRDPGTSPTTFTGETKGALSVLLGMHRSRNFC